MDVLFPELTPTTDHLKRDVMRACFYCLPERTEIEGDHCSLEADPSPLFSERKQCVVYVFTTIRHMLMFKKSSLEDGGISSTKAYFYFLSTPTNCHTITQEKQNRCTKGLLVTKPRVF